MAKGILTDGPVVTINAVSYGAGASAANRVISAATVNESAEEHDTTAAGDARRRREGGLKDGNFEITIKPDAALGPLQAINALLGTVVSCTWKRTTSAISSSNPELQFDVLVTQGVPVGGEVGGLMEQSVSWPLDTVVTYDVTP